MEEPGLPQTTVFVCSECDRHRPVLAALRRKTSATVVKVGCQKVCEGPVAGLMLGPRMEWFGRLRGDKPITALVTLVNDGAAPAQLPKPLAKRRSSKRAGRAVR